MKKNYPFTKPAGTKKFSKKGNKILNEENGRIRVIREYKPKKISVYMYSYNTIKIIDELLEDKFVSQLLNNCEVSKLHNYLSDIRASIGAKNLIGYRIWNDQRPEEYKLADTDEAKGKILALRKQILDYLKSPKAKK